MNIKNAKKIARKNFDQACKENPKKEIASSIIARVEAGFMFIQAKYVVPQQKAGGPDAMWIRSIYILFSFYFELLLKTMVVLKMEFKTIDELDSKLRDLKHKIESIGKEICDLKEIGIKNISLKNGEYKIQTFEGLIYVKDFIDIRYDFLRGKVRNLKRNEDKIIENNLKRSYIILEKIKRLL
jgi:hypothetical protein